jgi:hypothetical protein
VTMKEFLFLNNYGPVKSPNKKLMSRSSQC